MIKQFRWQGKQCRMGPVVLYKFCDLQRQKPKSTTETDNYVDFTVHNSQADTTSPLSSI